MLVAPATGADLRAFHQAMVDAIAALQRPTAPRPVFSCRQAELPPPAGWPGCVLLVADLNILAHSDGNDWIRQDTGAAI